MPEKLNDEEEHYKLITRRYLAWGIGSLATVTVAFIGIWGAITNRIELVTLAGGGLIGLVGSILGFYFSKKTSEE